MAYLLVVGGWVVWVAHCKSWYTGVRVSGAAVLPGRNELTRGSLEEKRREQASITIVDKSI